MFVMLKRQRQKMHRGLDLAEKVDEIWLPVPKSQQSWAVLWIRDVYTRSRTQIFPSRIQGQKDPWSVFASKNLHILNTTVSMLSEKWYQMFILDPGLFSRIGSRSWIHGSKNCWIPDPDPQHWYWIRSQHPLTVSEGRQWSSVELSTILVMGYIKNPKNPPVQR
jgi:hypothetical protein